MLGNTQSDVSSHAVVGGAAAALRTHPVDVLADVLDVAGLAVDAVGGVDDQLHVPSVIRLILVHSSRTESAKDVTKAPKLVFSQNVDPFFYRHIES